MKIEFGEVRLGDVARKHIQDCLDSNWVTMGEKVKLFEKKWAELNGVPYCVATNSGTSALICLLSTLYNYGAKRYESEVITTGLSFIATYNSILFAGFRPVFVDICPNDLNVDVDLIEEKITDKTVALLFPSLMGTPIKADKIQKLAHKYNLKFFVDNCEAHGAKLNYRPLENFCDAAAYSFFSAHVVFSGEQGAITTYNKEIAGLVYSIRTHGRENGNLYFSHPNFGGNFKPTDIHSAIGLESLENFHSIFNRRKNNLITIRDAVKGHDNKAYFTEYEGEDGLVVSPHGFSITMRECCKIDSLKEYLTKVGIAWKRNFGAPTQHGSFDWMTINGLENAEYVGKNGIHIGVHYYLSSQDVKDIAFHLNYYFNDIYSKVP